MKRHKSNVLDDLVTSSKFSGIPFDIDIAFSVLKQADPQEAMKFAVQMGRDRRFYNFVRVLRQEPIWEHWFQRDLQILRTGPQAYRNLFWDISDDEKKSDRPKFKVYYLWYRLLISAMQWNILYSLNEESKYFKRDVEFEFVRLNEFKIKKSRELEIFSDFRSDYDNLWETHIYKPDSNVQQFPKNYTAKLLKNARKTSIKRFLSVEYSKMEENVAEKIATVLEALAHVVLAKSYSIGHLHESFQKYINRVPRMVEATTVLVAHPCLQCFEEAEFCEANNHSNFFCGDSCHKTFYGEK